MSNLFLSCPFGSICYNPDLNFSAVENISRQCVQSPSEGKGEFIFPKILSADNYLDDEPLLKSSYINKIKALQKIKPKVYRSLDEMVKEYE